MPLPLSPRPLVQGGVFAGLALTGSALVLSGTLDSSTASSSPPAPAVAQAAAAPALQAPLPRERRVSRGLTRTALPEAFVTRTVAAGRTFSGYASWYGGSFQGQRTANGEVFDTHDLTAASRTLPFGTRLRVCLPARCVVVRVNDRGPYVGGRVLDLSQAARDELGGFGVALVTATPVESRRFVVRQAVPPAPARPVVPAVAAVPPAVVAPVPAGSAASAAAAVPVASGPVLEPAVRDATPAPDPRAATGGLLMAGSVVVWQGLRRASVLAQALP